jgi:hypothetical protein
VWRGRGRFALVILAWLAPGIWPVAAQPPSPLLDERPGPFVRDAFASAYGQAQIDELASALQAGADPACLQSKELTAEGLRTRGGELLVKWGTRTMEIAPTFIDAEEWAKQFAAIAGADAARELAQLRKHPEVARFLAVERPLRLARVVDFIVKPFNDYVEFKRLNLRSISPYSTRNAGMMRLMEKLEAERLEEIAARTTSRELRRYRRLSRKAGQAATVTGAADFARLMLFGPSKFYRGVEADLAELCIGTLPSLPDRKN